MAARTSRSGSGPARVRVLLIRHGQSTWNAEGRWQGRADPPLSELGGSRWTIPNLGGYVLERDDDHFVLGPRTALLDHELDADAVVDPAAE